MTDTKSATDTQFDYDLFVIGAGSGGTRASRVAAAHGARVAVAEEYRVGGTCVIRGCVPKKLLVYGSHFAEDLEDAAMFSWDVPQKSFNWPVLRDNVLAEVERLEGLYTQALGNHSVEIVEERAVIAGPNEVRLQSGRTVTAGKILIATGARPLMPDIPGIEHVISSNEARARVVSSGSPASKQTVGWVLPSPAWATTPMVRRWRSAIAATPSRNSASRLRGTHTSSIIVVPVTASSALIDARRAASSCSDSSAPPVAGAL